MNSPRLLCLLMLCGVALVMRGSPSSAAEPVDPWPGLVQDIFNNRAINDGNDILAIEMPYRAEDAAIVPVTLRSKLAPEDARRLKTITLVIDQNPAPMAAPPVLPVSETPTSTTIPSTEPLAF